MVQNQKKFDDKLHAAQLPAGLQIDNRVDKKLAGLDAKVKSIIKETVKSQSIKKEAISFDPTLFENELVFDEEESHHSSFPFPSKNPSKRSRQPPETVDLRSPTQSQHRKKKETRLQPQHLNPQGFICCLTFIFSKQIFNKNSLVN